MFDNFPQVQVLDEAQTVHLQRLKQEHAVHYVRFSNYRRVLEETLAGKRTYVKDNEMVKPIPLSVEDIRFIWEELRIAKILEMLLDVLSDYDYKYSFDQTCRADIGIHREKLRLLITSRNGHGGRISEEEELSITKFCLTNKKGVIR